MTPMREISADLWRMSATELAEAIRSKQVSSREVIEAHLRRIEAVDPEVNAVPGVADGLPQAVQVIGPRYREDLCLDAGQAIEASLGTITHLPPWQRSVR